MRTTLGATAVVGAAFLLGGLVMTGYLQRTLEQGRQDAAMSRAQDVAGLAAGGKLPVVLSAPNDDTAALQVVDSSGHVVASTSNIEGEAPIAASTSASAPSARTEVVSALDETIQFRIVSVPVTSPSGLLTVYAATSLQPAGAAVDALRRILLALSPLALALVAATTWVVTGRALRPVEAIRAEVAEISAGQLHRRVPETGRHDEIGRLAETMNSMLARIETSLDQQRRFVADASHELRTPLASVRIILENACTAPAATDWPRLVHDVLGEQERVERLVDDLLYLARLDSAPPRARRDVDLDELIRAELAWRARTGHQPIDYTATPGRWVRANPQQLTRVLRNLLDNAERYRAHTVSVSLTVRQSQVELRVIDDGPGIPVAERARVFDRFTRLDQARTHQGAHTGTGLGLAIVHDIVTNHGGDITIEDRPHGASFLVSLPVRGVAEADLTPTLPDSV
jgi:signal transduction histidine kinase